MNSIILRYGEIALKSNRNRSFFEKLYLNAIKEALKDYKIKIIPYGKRFIIHSNSADKFLEILNKIPGIQSFSPAHHFNFTTQEDILKEVVPLAKPLLKNKTFKVDTRRVGKHNFSSMDISMNLGKELEPLSQQVDLKNPQVTINLEIREDNCYFYTTSIEGVGGLPPTSAGRVLSLFSGGIDSPVAAYQMLKRGCGVDFLYINMLGDAQFNEIAKVYNQLISQYAHGYTPKFYVVNAFNLVQEIKDKVPSSLRQIALKMLFYKIGSKFAKKFKHTAIITGEALSQKSSQTIESLSVINTAATKLVIRPLIGMDKTEITKIARDLNTFKYSEKVKEFCNLSEGPVTTSPTMRVIEQFPNQEEEIESLEVLTFKGIIETKEEKEIILKNPKIVDIRDENKLKNKPIKSDIQIPYPEILTKFEAFNKNEEYLILCDFGLKSFDVAKKLTKLGFKVASTSVKKYLKENISCEK